MSSDPGPKVWVADLLTLSNGLFGFLSILTWTGELGPFQDIPNQYVAAAYIGLGLVADGVDGIVARAWGSTGLGDALDAINDALTFSVAPAVFLIGTYASTGGLGLRVILYLAAVALVVAGMLRLARHQNGDDGDVFVGLPTPWSAAGLVAVLLLEPTAWVALVATAGFAALNLSRIPYPKTRGRFRRTATLVLASLTLVVIAGVVFANAVRGAVFWTATLVALGLVLLAPLATR